MTGTGFVSHGTPCLTVTFAHERWWLQVARPDGEGYPEFAPYHQQPVAPADVRRFVPKVEALSWSPLRSIPGMPQACEAAAGDYVLHLNAGKQSDLDPEALVAELTTFMETGRGRRLTSV